MLLEKIIAWINLLRLKGISGFLYHQNKTFVGLSHFSGQTALLLKCISGPERFKFRVRHPVQNQGHLGTGLGQCLLWQCKQSVIRYQNLLTTKTLRIFDYIESTRQITKVARYPDLCI